MTNPPAPRGADFDAFGMPPSADTVTIATYDNYQAAQRTVDFLSDQKFPVEHTSIIGSDLVLVEKVTGRLTVVRAALAGASGGAWFGLLAGLLFGLWVRGGTLNWFALVVMTVIFFAIWGAAFGAVAHAMTRGQRDFASRSAIAARHYEVRVTGEQAAKASQLLLRLS